MPEDLSRSAARTSIASTSASEGRQAVLAESRASRSINDSFLERQNATDRHHNARKVRKTNTFSKDCRGDEAMTDFTESSAHFCWPVRTLKERDDRGHWRRRTPARAAELADHVWTIREWITMPGVQHGEDTTEPLDNSESMARLCEAVLSPMCQS